MSREKALPRAGSREKVSTSSPPAAVQVPRGVVARAWSRRRSDEMFRCRVIQFPNSPFPLMRNGFFRTARSGQGRAVSARRSEPLTAPGRPETVYEEGKEGRRLDRFL